MTSPCNVRSFAVCCWTISCAYWACCGVPKDSTQCPSTSWRPTLLNIVPWLLVCIAYHNWDIPLYLKIAHIAISKLQCTCIMSKRQAELSSSGAVILPRIWNFACLTVIIWACFASEPSIFCCTGSLDPMSSDPVQNFRNPQHPWHSCMRNLSRTQFCCTWMLYLENLE